MIARYPRASAPASQRLLALFLTLACIFTAQLGSRADMPAGTSTQAPAPAVASSPAAAPDFGKLPLSFVPNAGQTDPSVRFQAAGLGGTIFFTPREVVLSLPGAADQGRERQIGERLDPRSNIHDRAPLSESTTQQSVVRLRFVGASPTPGVSGAERLPGIVNYFLGNDPARWRTNVPTYAGVVYTELYPGIALRYDGHEGTLKGTYTVAAGADPRAIRWRYEGATMVQVDAATGDLRVELPGGAAGGRTLTERAPSAWQEQGGRRVAVQARYDVAGDGSVGFALGGYDAAQALIVDPTLVYSTYLGGSGDDHGLDIAVDGAGNVYIIGGTTSANFPTANPLQPASSGSFDAFVVKLNASGSALLFSTYLGGSGGDLGKGIAVDGAGNIYITGDTTSTNFPTTSPLQPASGGLDDAFVLKLNASGSALLFSTYLGGTLDDFGNDIAVDAGGNTYITGETLSTNFPTTSPLQPAFGGGDDDAFVAKLNASGSALLYSTYLGGSGSDEATGIAVDGAGNAYITGTTESTNFPTTSPLQPAFGGSQDAFVVKLNPNGSMRLFSTYLGGSGNDIGVRIAVDGAGNAYITGGTESTNFPTTSPLQATLGGSFDAFVVKLNPNGSMRLYSTYLGGSGNDVGFGIAVDGAGNAYISGHTDSTNFPTASPLQATLGGSFDAFVVKLNANGSARLYSSYLGGSGSDGGLGIAVDGTGNAYITGDTGSSNFPTANPLQANHSGSTSDAFVTKIATTAQLDLLKTVSTPTVSSCTSSPQTCTTITYRLTLKATGGVANADLRDEIPSGLNYVDGSATGGATHPAQRRIQFTGPVSPGSPLVITYQARLDPSVRAGSIFISTATLTGADSQIQRSAPLVVPDTAFTGTLVLIVADGDTDDQLSERMEILLNDAEQRADKQYLTTLVLLDGPGEDDTYLYRLQPDQLANKCPSYQDPYCGGRYTEGTNITHLSEADLGDPAMLTFFLESAFTGYPNAKHVVLSLVGHGGGWAPDVPPVLPSGHFGQPGNDPVGGMLWDKSSKNSLSTHELGSALDEARRASNGRRIDLLHLDACDMAMAEVAYEVHNSVDYVLASQNFKWAWFPYKDHLDAITSDTMDGRQIGTAWLGNEASVDRAVLDPFTVSLVQSSKIETVRTKTDQLGRLLSAALATDTPDRVARGRIINAATFLKGPDTSTQKTSCFYAVHNDKIVLSDSTCDLAGFARQIKAQFSQTPAVASAAQAVVDAVAAAVIQEVHGPGIPPQNLPFDQSLAPDQPWDWRDLGGISIFMPLLQDDSRRRFYGPLQFNQDGGWAAFLNDWWALPPDAPPPCPPDGCGPPIGPLLPPIVLRAAAGYSSITLTWNKPAGSVTSYRVSRGIGGGALSVIKDNVSNTSFVDSSGLNQGVTYCYRVEALNSTSVVAVSNFLCTKLASLAVDVRPTTNSYCADVKVTNTTNQPVDWQVTLSFTVPITVTNFWNANYNQNGNQVTARGVDWNKTLQPGQSTHDIGFCATLGSIVSK